MSDENMEPKAPSPQPERQFPPDFGPLSPEERREADKLRQGRLAKARAGHEQSLKEAELSELRRLRLHGPKDLSDKISLRFLSEKYGPSAT